MNKNRIAKKYKNTIAPNQELEKHNIKSQIRYTNVQSNNNSVSKKNIICFKENIEIINNDKNEEFTDNELIERENEKKQILEEINEIEIKKFNINNNKSFIKRIKENEMFLKKNNIIINEDMDGKSYNKCNNNNTSGQSKLKIYKFNKDLLFKKK